MVPQSSFSLCNLIIFSFTLFFHLSSLSLSIYLSIYLFSLSASLSLSLSLSLFFSLSFYIYITIYFSLPDVDRLYANSSRRLIQLVCLCKRQALVLWRRSRKNNKNVLLSFQIYSAITFPAIIMLTWGM